LNVEEVEKYDDQDWMQKWGSCDEEMLIEEEEEGRNFMQRNLDTPRVREEVILGIDDILGASRVSSLKCWRVVTLSASCPLFKQRFVWKNSDAMRYGTLFTLGEGMVLVDEELVCKYPLLMG
jgi:hypothetical protein